MALPFAAPEFHDYQVRQATTPKPFAPGDEQRLHRKRLQNRLNQRARRNRQKEKHGPVVPAAEQRPFRVGRWRLDEEQLSRRTPPPIVSRRKSALVDDTFCRCHWVQATAWESTLNAEAKAVRHFPKPEPDLMADTLLHLTQYNAFRGLLNNKMTLVGKVAAFAPELGHEVSMMREEGFRFPIVLQPLEGALPSNLMPTELQKTFSHASWIDFVPFPQMRDNLIRWEGSFSHREFCEDVIGTTFIHSDLFLGRTSAQDPPEVRKRWTVKFEDDSDTTKRGLVIWGDPHLPQNWEATLGFLQKWSWVAQGCDELIMSSNAWRGLRGEEPFCLEADDET